MENFAIPLAEVKAKRKKKIVYQSRITQFFKWIVSFLEYNVWNTSLFCFISEYLLKLEGKLAVYKRCFHIFRRNLKNMLIERRELKKEVRRLRNVVQFHEDLIFAALWSYVKFEGIFWAFIFLCWGIIHMYLFET